MPLDVRLLAALYSLRSSVDQITHFNAFGDVAGHTTPNCIGILPAYWQHRRSNYLIVSGFGFLLIHLAQLGQMALIDYLASHLEGSYELCAKTRAASQKTVNQPVLTSEELAVDAELGQLLNATVDVKDVSLERWSALRRPPNETSEPTSTDGGGSWATCATEREEAALIVLRRQAARCRGQAQYPPPPQRRMPGSQPQALARDDSRSSALNT